MKLLHLSDLHIGKRVNGYSMLEDQQYILKKILELTEEEKPDGVIIAGDVYDKSVAPAEAVGLFDDFLVGLSELTPHTFIISGNHDSPERLAFGGRLMEKSGIHISPVYNGELSPVSLNDRWGAVDVYMLPFVKPVNVRQFFPDEEITGYTDAVKTALTGLPLNKGNRNVLITHQFVTGAERCESEEISVGGSDNVDASVFEGFDYVALGHIHGAQNIGSERIRYCGTPLKYSFSEANHKKSVTIVELGEKPSLTVMTIPLKPMRDMVNLRGSYYELVSRAFYESTSYRDDYTRITLTDEQDIPDAMAKLRVIYNRLMKLDYDNSRTRGGVLQEEIKEIETKTPLQLFEDFYEKQNGVPMTREQSEFVLKLIEGMGEEF